MRPDDSALLINDRIAPAMNILHDEVIAEFELRKAIHRHSVDGTRGLVLRAGSVCGWRSVFDSMAIFGERIGSSAVDALAVVLLKAGKVSVGDSDQFLTGHALGGRNGFEPEGFGFIGLVHVRDIVRTTAAGLEVNAFYFG